MPKSVLKKRQLETIDSLVEHFNAHRPDLERFLNQLREFLIRSDNLMQLVHSVKWRTKDPAHLRDKLMRKAVNSQKHGVEFAITSENLFEKVTDLVGFRILHLHTSEFPGIHKNLLDVLKEGHYRQVQKPFVRSWDDETKALFRDWGLRVEKSPTMYTSVHYVVQSNLRTRFTCEIQVRTLMEEVWGEVDHSINYPYQTESVACLEQIRALARLTSGCTRLVDSIFRSHDEYRNSTA